MTGRVLVVGASHAGVQVAAKLRESGHAGPITLVGAEGHLPYHRPPLSKAYMLGDASRDSLALRNRAFYADRGVDLLLGSRVRAIDPDTGEATTDSGATLGFDHLVLATGARAKCLPVPGADLAGVVRLRSLDDADHLALLLPGVRRAVVVGGGFIGLEAASVLRGRGIEVTLIEAGERLMARSVTPILSDWYAALHRGYGTAVRLGTGVAAVEGAGGTVSDVVLRDGSRIPADLVVIGVGVHPRTELAESLGLDVSSGVVVDHRARTSRRDVLAVGDLTVQPHPLEPGCRVRLESVQNATDQANAAAATLLGDPDEDVPVPWFWSDQFHTKLQMVGAPPEYDDLVVRGSLEGDRFSVLCYRDGRLVGGESVNSAADFVALRRALASGVTLPPDHAAKPGIKLKSLL